MADEGLALDHILLAVDDLDAGGAALEGSHGLASLIGGRHPDWGTANRIVPLGDWYLELVAVDDADQAQRSPFGRWVAGRGAGALFPLGWAVRTSSIDAVAARLGLAVAVGSRTRPDGQVLTWRIAGVAEAAAEPCRPFFIEWGEGTPHPGGATVGHDCCPVDGVQIELTGDPARMAAWLGAAALPITLRPGPPGVERIRLDTPGGPIVLSAADR